MDFLLIDSVLYYLNNTEISLEEAISKSEKALNKTNELHQQEIRDFLIKKDLLEHNPRLTFKNVKTPIKDGVVSIDDEINEEFIKDYLTEAGKEFVVNQSFSNKSSSILSLFEK